MNWGILVSMGIFLAAFFALKRLSFVSAAVAQRHLKQGALVIDVRSPGEFHSGHVPAAINIPLGELRESLPRRVPDKRQTLLVHCLSGGRSAIARQQLKRLGYANVFNLGSLARAKTIVNATQKD
ncbi:MAG: rhodanese-like domain-containing protein [Verrucomicrobiota bacterium]